MDLNCLVSPNQWRPLGLLMLAAGTGDPSLQAVGALELACWCQHTRSQGRSCGHGGPSLWEKRESWVLIAGMGFQEFSSEVLLQAWGTKPAGLCILLPMGQWCWFHWCFRGKVAMLCSRGEHGAPSSCVCQEAGLTSKRPSNGAWSCWKTSGAGIGSVEL
jgi:hypothetical protein